ncbi:MAG: gamma-glutamyltransferase [Desulfovibrio sp.]|jgi:gamma-glutamyltranspeptidase/glutathione hydrolase|nr:gamma-glutamyltransferase [Desulfovibrio sp.]
MLYTARAFNGMVVTPHRLASESGIAVLRKGGNAIEAAIAAAASLCVVYPHMTGIGGDAVWIILPAPEHRDDQPEPVIIDACGRSAQAAGLDWYKKQGCDAIPARGPLAALTMAGAVSGWEAALTMAEDWARRRSLPSLGLETLFEDAVGLAENGCPVSASQSVTTASLIDELAGLPGFAQTFLMNGRAPGRGKRQRFPALARTFRRLAQQGLDSFYRGDLALEMAEDLAAAGSPLAYEDFSAHAAEIKKPISLEAFGTRIYSSPPPTQGFCSLLILGLVERFAQKYQCNFHDRASLIHSVVEATKLAFLLRDRMLADPKAQGVESLLTPEYIEKLLRRMSPDHTLPWPPPENGAAGAPGRDTVWIGVMDAYGDTVSCIQSIYHEFGAGLILPRSGVIWHNRGLGFSVRPGYPNALGPGKKPFHTLNPALARFNDGRIITYGAMGGDGQPQTQAAIFLRHLLLGAPLQGAVNETRWLLGRSWGEESHSLKLEQGFSSDCVRQLRGLGHNIEMAPAFSSLMGHAGMLARHPDGLLEGAFDPRGDGAAACW